MTEIKAMRPPNFNAIVEVFPNAVNRGVIFAYAPYIYVPSGNKLPPQLIAHEEVHIRRQEKQGVENWWFAYLTDPAFRYEEELLAHRAEWEKLTEGANRQVKRAALKEIAKKLAAPLYNKMVTRAQAEEDIKNAAAT